MGFPLSCNNLSEPPSEFIFGHFIFIYLVCNNFESEIRIDSYLICNYVKSQIQSDSYLICNYFESKIQNDSYLICNYFECEIRIDRYLTLNYLNIIHNLIVSLLRNLYIFPYTILNLGKLYLNLSSWAMRTNFEIKKICFWKLSSWATCMDHEDKFWNKKILFLKIVLMGHVYGPWGQILKLKNFVFENCPHGPRAWTMGTIFYIICCFSKSYQWPMRTMKGNIIFVTLIQPILTI